MGRVGDGRIGVGMLERVWDVRVGDEKVAVWEGWGRVEVRAELGMRRLGENRGGRVSGRVGGEFDMGGGGVG